MLSNTNLLFKEFAQVNLAIIQHPTRNKCLTLPDIDSLSDLLFHFLNHEVPEASLQRVKSNFENDFIKIYNLDLPELASAIEGLAANFESFLKKIAYVKFNNNLMWLGDGTYKGISKCTLYDLIEGKTPTIDSNNFKNFPSPLVSHSGTSKSILDFVRELRNKVHSAISYNRFQLIQYSNLVLGSYLIAVYDNLDFLKKKFFPEFSYLESIATSKEYQKLNQCYIEIYGKEDLIVFDSIAIEQLDGQKLIDSLTWEMDEEVEDEKAEYEVDKEIARIDSVSNIARDTARFIIIGEPGSGKTTSMQKIMFENAAGILNGNQECRLPVFIKASSYSLSNSFSRMLQKELSFCSFEDLKSRHKILVLIDGLNEIDEKYKRQASLELSDILHEYNDFDFIVSARKHGFFNVFHLNIYELKKLNESQIKSLLCNVLDAQRGEGLWQQLQLNKEILELASNPLMLMMIIKVASISNDMLPPNKGTLYKLFNEAILIREQKYYSTDVSTKKDVLANLAFWMRSNGMFKKIPIAKAKKIIQFKLSELNAQVEVNKLISEFVDNNFFIEKNEELEFYHETQQEYFVALELKNIFFKLDLFDFDYRDNRWLEPLIICSDLFTSDKDRLRYFELIFIGKKNETSKKLGQFDSSDLDPKFYIGCKIAYNLKSIHPFLYSTAERYLNNYISMWHYRRSHGAEIVDFEVLIKAVASLSSPAIFERFFLQLKNLSHWFYNEQFDLRNDSDVDDDLWEGRYNRYLKSFSDNLNDFSTLYSILLKRKNALNTVHCISRSIYYNFRYFYKYLIENVPIGQLIVAFKANRNKEILLQIGRNDLDFFIENYYTIPDAESQGLYEFVGKFHIRNAAGISYLIAGIKNTSIDISVRIEIVETLINKLDDHKPLFEALSSLLKQNDVLLYLDELKLLINKFLLQNLKEYGLDVIFRIPEVEKIAFKMHFVQNKDGYDYFEAHNNHLDYKEILNNTSNIYVNDRNVEFQRVRDFYSKELNEVLVVSGNQKAIEDCFTKFAEGGTMSIYYLDTKRQSVTATFSFKELFRAPNPTHLLIHVNALTVATIKKALSTNKNLKLIVGQQFRFDVRETRMYHTSIFLKCKTTDVDRNLNSLKFEVYKISIDFSRPFNYHRDILKVSEPFLRHIKKNIGRPDVINFVTEIGMCHVFRENIRNLEYGIIVNKSPLNNAFKVCVIHTNKVITTSLNNSLEEELNINEVVIVEKNRSITKLPSEQLPENLFLTSEIVDVSQNLSEGFIKNPEGGKDYYFHSQFCNFIPYAGLVVRFLPGINTSKNNSLLPMAYCASPLRSRNRYARATKVVIYDNHQDVHFVDLDTQTELFSRVYQRQIIVNHSGIIKEGDIFAYYVPNRYRNEKGRPRVYLIAKDEKLHFDTILDKYQLVQEQSGNHQ